MPRLIFAGPDLLGDVFWTMPDGFVQEAAAAGADLKFCRAGNVG